MAEETVNTVRNISDGTVTIAVERYQELLEKSAEKTPVIYNTVQKTQAMVAQDNKVWGGILLSGGLCLSVLGAGLHLLGRAQQKALRDEIRTQQRTVIQGESTREE